VKECLLEAMGLCNLYKEGLCAKKGKDVSAIKRRERGGV